MQLIIVIEKSNEGIYSDELCQTFKDEYSALKYIGDVASGKKPDTTLKNIHKIDTTYSTIKKMELVLVDFKLTLREV